METPILTDAPPPVSFDAAPGRPAQQPPVLVVTTGTPEPP